MDHLVEGTQRFVLVDLLLLQGCHKSLSVCSFDAQQGLETLGCEHIHCIGHQRSSPDTEKGHTGKLPDEVAPRVRFSIAGTRPCSVFAVALSKAGFVGRGLRSSAAVVLDVPEPEAVSILDRDRVFFRNVIGDGMCEEKVMAMIDNSW